MRPNKTPKLFICRGVKKNAFKIRYFLLPFKTNRHCNMHNNITEHLTILIMDKQPRKCDISSQWTNTKWAKCCMLLNISHMRQVIYTPKIQQSFTAHGHNIWQRFSTTFSMSKLYARFYCYLQSITSIRNSFGSDPPIENHWLKDWFFMFCLFFNSQTYNSLQW